MAILAQDGPHGFRRAGVVTSVKASVPCGRLALITQEASVSHGTDWPYLALSVPWDNLHTWASVSGDRLAYGTYAVRSLPWRVALIAFQDRGPWKLGLTTGQHAGRLLAGFGKGCRLSPRKSMHRLLSTC